MVALVSNQQQYYVQWPVMETLYCKYNKYQYITINC